MKIIITTERELAYVEKISNEYIGRDAVTKKKYLIAWRDLLLN
jgi:hypothetical protein